MEEVMLDPVTAALKLAHVLLLSPRTPVAVCFTLRRMHSDMQSRHAM